MPNDEHPVSTSSGEDQGSDGESLSDRCDSMTSTSEMDCSRESFTSTSSSKHCSPSSSPPKTLTLNKVMESARDLSNLSIAHEITVNPDFRVEPSSLPEGSLWKAVKNAMHKAFWNILESELNDDPPVYGQAIRLLEEIREILLSFLNPGANRMRTQIMEVLDIELIRQQADNDAVDIQGLASYIINTMGKLCTPARDEDVKKLRESTDNIVTLFREIFRVLDLMKVDMINATILSLRAVLCREGIEYERASFQRILDKTPNALSHSSAWLKSAMEEMMSAIVCSQETGGQGKGERTVPNPIPILNTAFLGIITWDFDKKPLPETLMNDEVRLREIKRQLWQCQMVNEVLLIVHSTIGDPIQGLPSLSERLKRMTHVLLDGMHHSNFNMDEALESVSSQISCEINKSLTERNFPALTPALQANLRGQICSITQKDNPIRTLVEDRVQQFFRGIIFDPKPQAKLEQVPAGLTAIQPELTTLGAKFISLVNYNKTVYGPFYADILRKLISVGTSPAASPAPDPTHESISSN